MSALRLLHSMGLLPSPLPAPPTSKQPTQATNNLHLSWGQDDGGWDLTSGVLVEVEAEVEGWANSEAGMNAIEN